MERTIRCRNCTRGQPTVQTDSGLICCTFCGKVVDQDIYSTEPTFVKNAAGQSQLAGSVVRSVQSDYSASRERTLNYAYDFITHIADNLGVGGGDQIARPALAFYTIALERNFTRGRRADQVAAACLYIACRENKKPFLLIEFSEFLRVNVYVLGAVFLQLCKVLWLEEHPIVQKPVDPSLFIHRFSNNLLGEINHDIEKTALRIITSMKQNWMQTGRKPSGICGAALYVSALSHGHKVMKSDIVKIVHICEATLTKRLIEFENTDSGSLTIEELNQKAEELERNYGSNKHSNVGYNMSGKGELLCEHRGSGVPYFAHGLCEHCYAEFINISGGLEGGAEPPAFQRADTERKAKTCSDEIATDSSMKPGQLQSSRKNSNRENKIRILNNGRNEESERSDCGGVPIPSEAVDTASKKLNGADVHAKSSEDSESFSDIDDAEVDHYIHTEEEKHFKEIIWKQMNADYLEEQAAKEAAAAREAYEASFQNCSDDMLVKKEFAAAVGAAVSKSKKERRDRRAAEAMKPQTAAEAAHAILNSKRLSSKINYDKLQEMLDIPESSDGCKKRRTELHSENNMMSDTRKVEVEVEDNSDELGTMGEYEYEGMYDAAEDHGYSYYDHEEEGYDDYDDGLC
ncbi:hypothetical protein Nepgr_010939 [Nepenthes gracilis]|uniref:Cyclin-like domain-containing protein n=1 Tax=Nepenthes gracilis TaxID=150966 RepID=A0AAD3SDX0_NEPGR|nr:hypothetical protein Nepgr_010939 [Nepenthes gracilis]